MKIVAYLTFNGNAQEAIKFYESVFDSKAQVMTFGEMPPDPSMPALNDEQKKLVMHADLPVEGSDILFSDTIPGMEYQDGASDKISLTVAFATVDQAHKIFTKLSDGGTIYMPIEKTFWSPAFGMLVDKFGVTWQVSAE